MMSDSFLVDCGVCFVIERAETILDARRTFPKAARRALLFRRANPRAGVVNVYVSRTEALVRLTAAGAEITWIAARQEDDRVLTI